MKTSNSSKMTENNENKTKTSRQKNKQKITPKGGRAKV